ncbi:MAG: T9SS type A sorting domain-containing protein [Bacteroidetes bacterium]|nr:T9SS type A sorting domain-containing protein [Bacteroidota bacterium]
MKRKAGFFFFIFLNTILFGQQSIEVLQMGGIRYYVQNAGVNFENRGKPGFEVPKGSGVYGIRSSGLWVGGQDSSGGIRLAIACYDSSGRDFQPGPVDRSTIQADDTSYWNFTWHVDSAQVAIHKSAYNNSNYTAPWVIENWPGSNSRPGDYSPVLAPFIDLNQNMIYEPDSGEIPYFKGQEAAYSIYNDKRPYHQQSGTQAMGLEVYQMVYTMSELPQVVFVQYRIINRSYSRYDSVYAGIYTDFMLGFDGDNYISTDSARNSYFCYNGYPYDSNGYLDQPPVMGVKFLNARMNKSISFNWNTNNYMGWPETPQEYYGYMKAKWKDGSEISDPNSSQKSFLFQGDPCKGSGWTEYGSSGIVPGRRNMLGTTGPVSLNHGDIIKLDIAYIFTQKQKSVLDNICDYYIHADEVQNYWKQNISGLARPKIQGQLKCYPNPTSGILHWELPHEKEAQSITLCDMQGRCITINPAAKEMDTRKLAHGIYLLRIQDYLGNTYSAKVIVE